MLVLGTMFFVAAEYGMVSARKSRIDALARKGNRAAKALSPALDDVSPFVAASQVAITMIGIGVGTVTEPFVTEMLVDWFGNAIPHTVSFLISFLCVTFVLVVVGELVPKYLVLGSPEKVALLTFRPMLAFVTVLKPLIWLVQKAAALVLRLFGRSMKTGDAGIAREELMMLIQSGGAEGTLDKLHAEMVTKALKLDVLDARDIMVHRLDIKWVDVRLDKDALLERLSIIPFTRLPVCRGDIDDMVGIAYLHDVVKNLSRKDFQLEKLLRPLVAIPENLTMEKIVATMRDQKTQILIVMDEYGGTSGLITLEDVVEEVFGELEDTLESERPPIELFQGGRVSAKSDVRLDELVDYLHLPIETGENTDTLAQIIVDALDRIPRPGDSIESILGTVRVENMARRRITRVSIQLRPELVNAAASD
ncbi:MAG TPA: hemolysin family protein [Fimbriimonadaceae bacterium]|nr:hemolysin family protein [Fimbriimonadaceae bacterium]